MHFPPFSLCLKVKYLSDTCNKIEKSSEQRIECCKQT